MLVKEKGMIYYKMEMLPEGSLKYQGVIDDSIRFIQENQLKDIQYWKLFIKQFKLGNVDDQKLSWRGEYWGKMMRGASLTYIYTQDNELYDIIEKSVRDMLETQDDLGRFSTYSVEKEFNEWDMWCRKYVMLGMFYFLDICRDGELKSRIVEAMTRHADYIISKIGPSEDGKLPITKTSIIWKALNSSSILEPFVRLYVITGYERYLDFSRHIIDCGFIDGFNIIEACLENRLMPFEFPVTKAYEMMSCFEGLLWYYRVTGEKKYLDAAENFARNVEKSDITVIGSAGCTHELFDNSKVNQFNPDFTGIMQETCVTVTWIKLCQLLFQLTGKKEYLDYIEKSVYNALLGAVNTEKKSRDNSIPWFDSYSPLRMGVRGEKIGGYQKIDDTYYGCCMAIAAAGTALAALSSVYRTEDGFYFAQYITGSIKTTTPKGRNIVFDVVSSYPFAGIVKVEINMETEEEFLINFRIPSESKKTIIKVNGKTHDTCIMRKWKKGDVVEIHMTMPLRLLKDSDILPEAEQRERRYGVFVKGPIVMAVDQFIESNRFDEAIHVNTDKDGYVLDNYEVSDVAFKSNLAIVLHTEERDLVLVDYASCGKSWDEEYPMAAWVEMDFK
jgi:DUF1680 family protein